MTWGVQQLSLSRCLVQVNLQVRFASLIRPALKCEFLTNKDTSHFSIWPKSELCESLWTGPTVNFRKAEAKSKEVCPLTLCLPYRVNASNFNYNPNCTPLPQLQLDSTDYNFVVWLQSAPHFQVHSSMPFQSELRLSPTFALLITAQTTPSSASSSLLWLQLRLTTTLNFNSTFKCAFRPLQLRPGATSTPRLQLLKPHFQMQM